jgi:Immunoglobulin-like domain of bacterial spore germination/Sporulation and spore germination
MDAMTARTRTRLAALLATSVVVLGACGTDDDPRATDANTTPSQSDTPSSPEPTDPSGPTDSGSGMPATVAAPLYFVGDTPQGPRLFREFQKVETENPADEALAVLAAGDALDPDYRSLLPQAQITVPSYDEHIVVSVTSDWATRPDGMSTQDAKLAVQQVVYTVQGVLQRRSPVDFVVDGNSTDVLGLGASSFKASQDALALVNVTVPEEGSIAGDTFTASGVANSFEATVPWEVREPNGKKVLHGFATAEGWGDKLYPWETSVDVSGLAPGTYSFVAMTDDPSGGEGGGPQEDSKTIIIQ